MSYRVVLEKDAEKYLRRQDKASQTRILKAINLLPDNGDIKKLAGTAGLFRVRVGKVRVIYSMDSTEHVIRIIAIGSRGQIYDDIN